MKVRELIERLERENSEAEVLLLEQPQWPFEYELRDVVTRALTDNGRCGVCDHHNHGDPCRFRDCDNEVCGCEGEHEDPEDGKIDDVFLVEGRQIRYGPREGWR